MRRVGRVGILVLLAALPVSAQRVPSGPAGSAATRLAILAAEDRRAPTPRDLAVIRAGARSGDAQTARIAVRALGRLERPELIADILPALRTRWPEIRAEAANAVAQAAQGWVHKSPSKAPRTVLDAALIALVSRLTVEPDTSVRAVLAGTIGRLPYASAEQVDHAERVLLDLLGRRQSAGDRLGVARGFEALIRTRRKLSLPATAAVDSLRVLAMPVGNPPRSDLELASRPAVRLPAPDPARDARVRRLAMEALIAAEAVDDEIVRRALADPDAQVRRLTMRAIGTARLVSAGVAVEALRQGLSDAVSFVRLEALHASRRRQPPALDHCTAAINAVRDADTHVALAGVDVLAGCRSAESVNLLERMANDISAAGVPRGWHRSAHAIVALAHAAPSQASSALPQFTGSRDWQLRIHAARAAAVIEDRSALEKLARDLDANVREVAIEGLTAVAGHGADAVYIEAIAAGGYQVLRVAAAALAGTRAPEAAPALTAALRLLVVEGRDNSLDARTAIVETLRGLGVPADATPRLPARAQAATAAGAPAPAPRTSERAQAMSAADMRRLASARARITIRGVGSIDLAIIGAEAPATALRFARLAESGYYNGLTFHRVVPNFVIQGGSPGANEYIGDSAFMRDEVGQWPHVRGAVGISTRGRDTGDAQIFIDLVDNPRLDHEFTVFAHVLNGMDVVDAILEGDVIEKVEILT